MDYTQNNLSQLNYKVQFAKLPQLNYRAQTVNIPGMQLTPIRVPTQLGLSIPVSGNLMYDTLDMTFIVGENLEDYLSIFDWMVQLGHPDSLSQFPKSKTDVTSDASVIITNSSQNPLYRVDFTNAFPTSLSPLMFDSTLTETVYMQASVSFAFERFYFKPVL
jgi:hypothetical protein